MTAMTRSIAPNSRRPVSRRRGFTLTEVLLVLAILGVIAAMVVPNLLGRQREAMVKTTKMSIKSFADAAEQFAVSHDGMYPEGGANEAIGLLTNPGADSSGRPISPYLKSEPKDAWGMTLHYECNKDGTSTKAPNFPGPAIWSSGPDKTNDDGANDDVCSWR